MSDSYKIILPQFEGPFDLLLFFIERDELDIYDIPIAKITTDFLDFMRQMERKNIELASEFILVAATLMRIKAKMLLPRKELDEEGNEIDPRKELVAKLIEYRQYKQVISEFQRLEEARQQIFVRGNILEDTMAIRQEYEKEAELHSLTLYKLLEAFQRVLKRYEAHQQQPQHVVINFPYTVDEEKEQLLALLRVDEATPFTDIFTSCKDRIQAIFRFLALLELAHLLYVHIGEVLGINQFEVRRLSEAERQQRLGTRDASATDTLPAE